MPADEQGPASTGTSSRWARVFRWADIKAVPLRTILVTVGVIVLVYLAGQLLYRLRDVVLLVVVGSFVALVLNPAVLALLRWKIRRRGTAVAIVTVSALLVFIGLAFAFGYPLVNSLTHFANALPAYVDKAQHGKGWIGHLVRKYHIEAWVQKNSPKIVSFAENLGRPALSLGKGAFAALAELAATFAFVVMLLVEAPKIRAGLLDMMSVERATRYAKIGSKVSDSISGFVLGDFLTSLIAGTVIFVTLAILGVPYALLFGLWVALVDFLPQIGGALAGIPTVLFSLAHSFTAGVVTLVVFLVYTFLENHLLNPVVMSRTVKINPLVVFVAVLVGADVGNWLGGLFGGFVAVLLAVPIAASLQIVIVEIWKATASTPPVETEH
jgi:predicted PurR-regulated permease PerM